MIQDKLHHVVYHFRQFSMVIPDEREQIAPVLYLIPFVSAMVSHEPFEEVWDNIQKHEGEIFRTKTGIKFSYLIKNERIYIVGYEKKAF